MATQAIAPSLQGKGDYAIARLAPLRHLDYHSVWEGVVASESLERDGGLVDKLGVELALAVASEGRMQRRLGQRVVRKARSSGRPSR